MEDRNGMEDVRGKVALITGASRGIGARVATLLAERGADVVINYRTKGGRAEEIAAAVRGYGVRAILAQADLTEPQELVAMIETIQSEVAQIDVLILNASGGLEKDKPHEYAMVLNRDAQIQTLEQVLPLMPVGGRVLFITSHWAHFYGQKPVYHGYEIVAASKRAGEDAIRALMPLLTQRGIRLIVISGDVIEGTITPKLLERNQPGLLAARREQAGTLPTIDDFAMVIVESVMDQSLQNGDVVFVGSIN
jgi:NAD(P)-dependent dehydrogenase (short-subunit alcohol dehydrogenase family)